MGRVHHSTCLAYCLAQVLRRARWPAARAPSRLARACAAGSSASSPRPHHHRLIARSAPHQHTTLHAIQASRHHERGRPGQVQVAERPRQVRDGRLGDEGDASGRQRRPRGGARARLKTFVWRPGHRERAASLYHLTPLHKHPPPLSISTTQIDREQIAQDKFGKRCARQHAHTLPRCPAPVCASRAHATRLPPAR